MIFDPDDKEEKKLYDEIENNEWIPVSAEKRAELLNLSREAAVNTIRKDARMNIRLTETDMLKLKIKAMEKGIPYQTLVTEIIHEYVKN